MSEKKLLIKWSKIFLFINFIIITILFARYAKYIWPPQTILSFIYLIMALLSQGFLISFITWLVILIPLILVLPKRYVVFPVGIIAVTISILILIINYEVYAQYSYHLNPLVFQLIINGGSEIFDFSLGTYIVAFIVLATIVMMEIIISQIIWRYLKNNGERKSSKMMLFAVLGGLIVTLLSNCVYAVADVTSYRPITLMARHIPFYQPLTARGFLQKHGIVNISEIDSLSTEANFNSGFKYPAKSMQCESNGNNMNILFIVIDCLRFDMLNKEVTPNIYQFVNSRPTTIFLNHLSGGNGTRIGIFSLFYGLFGNYWDPLYNEGIGPVLVNEMIKRNYQMGIFASAKLSSIPFDKTVFVDVKNLRLKSEGKYTWQRDQNITDEWLKWLNHADESKPFFGFLFYDSPHAYSIPPDYKKIFEPMLERVDYHKLDEGFDPVPFKNGYMNSIHYADSLVGNVLKDLERKKLLDKTIIVITADHGQEFNESKHNYWGHGSNFTKYQIQVPLVVYWPRKDKAVYTHMTSHLDVVPTLMENVFQCKNAYADYSNGRSLFDTSKRKWAYSGGFQNSLAIIEPDRITATYPVGTYEIYDLSFTKIKNAKLHFDVIKEVMDQASIFYFDRKSNVK